MTLKARAQPAPTAAADHGSGQPRPLPAERSDALRWLLQRLGLLLLTAVLLLLSFAPYYQAYLAWVGLVPWLLVVRSTSSVPRALAWGWLGGVAFFTVTMPWMFRATVPGTIALIAYLSLFWGLAAAVIRRGRLLDPPQSGGRIAGSILLFAATWSAAEWLRATLLTGLPWVLLGQSQTPLLALCQVADITGIYGIGFWLAAVNGLVAWLIIVRHDLRRALIPAAAVAAMLLLVVGYGLYRLSQDATSPGPRIMVVQPNHRHERGGAQTVTQEQQIAFHFGRSGPALEAQRDQDHPVDLIVWSETVMPPLNAEARHELRNEPSGAFLRGVHERLAEFARHHRVTLVAGAYFVGGWQPIDGKRTATDIRNSVYVYQADGSSDGGRYDKSHLVPFGEFLPFEKSCPPLHRLFRYLAAPSVSYSINAAPPGSGTVFEVRLGRSDSDEPVRFVTPICFEDTDPALVARMFRPGANGKKGADLIVNVTNDGWFVGNQQAQHLQAAVLRSIENRAPTARASNTGISGFIDSYGRTEPSWQVSVGTAGTLTHTVALDRRVAVYSRAGDVFAYACVAVTAVLALSAAFRGSKVGTAGAPAAPPD